MAAHTLVSFSVLCVYVLCVFIGFCLLLLRLIYIANLPQGIIIIIILLPKSQGKITYIMKPVQPVLKFFIWMLYKVLVDFKLFIMVLLVYMRMIILK